MTTYRRRGHYRRGRNGQRHWVSAHSVTRGSLGHRRTKSRLTSSVSSNWFSQTSRPTPAPRPAPIRFPALPYSARWLKPNARCPVCGAAVYFWSNAAGSRVYFDEMGPPWPKHPCTDFRAGFARAAGPQATYRTSLAPETPATAGDFRGRFAARPAQAYEILRAVRDGWLTRLHVRRVGWLRWRTVFVIPYQLMPLPGQLVFVTEGQLTLLDHSTLQVLEFPAVTGQG